MEFASNHVYLGAEEEAEVDDDVLQAVEQSGGLLNAIGMAQQMQLAAPMAPLDEVRKEDADMSFASGSCSDDEEPAAPPRAGAGAGAAGVVPATPASQMADLAIAPGAPNRRHSRGSRSRSRSRSPLGRPGAPAAAAAEGAPKSGGFFSKLFGSSSSSSNAAPKVPRERKMKERPAGLPPHGLAPPRAQQEEQQRQSASFLNFLNRSAAPQSHSGGYGGAPPPPPAPSAASMGGFDGMAGMKKKKAYKRAVDTNILAIKFNSLAKESDELFAGDVVLCGKCGAALNHLSTLIDHNGAIVKAGIAQQSAPVAAAASQVAPGGLAVVVEAPAAAPSEAAAPSGRGALPADVHLEDGQQLWPCDFCAHANVLDGLQPAEIPTHPSRDYVLEPAPASASAKCDEADSSYVIFCLDISGSMCVSTPVPGRIALKGRKAIDPALLAFNDVDMSGVGANARETYISRLQAVQASIDSQLTNLARQNPNRRVLLVTFNSEVTIIGDGTNGNSVVITGDKLTQEAELERIGREYAQGKPISQSKEQLTEALFNIEETGPTALGPALVTSIAIASRARGSTVIICTDGIANVGCGQLSLKGSRESEEAVENWYSAQGVKAREAGVVVNVVSIKGDECRLELLGLVAAETLGQVVRVDPTTIASEFGNILSNPLIATNVSVTFFLHSGLQFRNEEAAQAQEQAQAEMRDAEERSRRDEEARRAAAGPMEGAAAAAAMPVGKASVPPAPPREASMSRLTRQIGNVTKDSETTLEYGLRSRAELAKFAHLPSLPFQCLITFTMLNGSKVLRVLTQAQAVTFERAVAEKDVKLELVAAQVASKSAALARDGHYREARANWISSSPMLARAAQSPAQQQIFANYSREIDAFDRVVAQQSRMEAEAGGGSDAEEEAGAPGNNRARTKRSKRAKMSDESYRIMHRAQQLHSAALSSPPPPPGH